MKAQRTFPLAFLCVLALAALPIPVNAADTRDIVALALLGTLALAAAFILYLIFWLASHKPVTLLEGEVSNIRIHSTVQPAPVLKTCFLTRITVTRLLLNDTPCFARFCDEFDEQLNVHEGDRLRVAGYPQAKALRIYAFHNLTQGTQSKDGFERRLRGGVFTITLLAIIGLLLGFIPDGLALSAALLNLLLGAWILGCGYRYKNALNACLVRSSV